MADEIDVKVNITGDTKGLDKTLQKTGTAMDRLNKKAVKAGAAFKSMGMTLSMMSAPIVALGYTAVNAAAQAEESENLFEVSFGNMSKAAREWSENLSKAVGISAYTIREQSAMLFTMTSSMGIAEDASFGLATGLTELAQDMASFYNLPIEQAFMKLQAGITGEAEPLKRLGILVGENFVKETEYARAITDTGRKMTEQEKVMARYHAIMAQTGKAQGDLLRTQDSFTNRSRKMQEQMKDLQIEIGQQLLPMLQMEFMPMMISMVDVAKEAIQWYASLGSTMKSFVNVIGGLAISLGPVMLMLGKLLEGFKMIGPVITTVGIRMSEMRAGFSMLPGALKEGKAGLNALLGSMSKVTQGLLVLGVGVAAFKATDMILELTGLRDVLDDVFEKMAGLKEDRDDPFAQPQKQEWQPGIGGIPRKVWVDDADAVSEGVKRITQAEELLNREIAKTPEGYKAATLAQDVYSQALQHGKTESEALMYAQNALQGVVVDFDLDAIIQKTYLWNEGQRAVFQSMLDEGVPAAEAFRLMQELIYGATESTEALTKAEIKRQQAYKKAVQGMAAGMGFAKLKEDAQKMADALALLSAQGAELSEAGLQQVVEMYEKLVEAGKPVPASIDKIASSVSAFQRSLEKIVQGRYSAQLLSQLDHWEDAATRKFGPVITPDQRLAREQEAVEEELAAAEAARQAALPGGKQFVGPMPQEFAQAEDSMLDYGNAIRDLAAAFQVLGMDAQSAIGAIVAGAAQLGAALPAIRDSSKSIIGDAQGNKVGRGISAGAQGAMATMSATASGSQTKRALSGAMSGAAAGGQIGGPIGAAVGAAAGAILGWARGAGPAKVMKTIGEKWGLDISQELAETISKTADKLDLGKFEAAMLHIGDIIRDQGGLSESNLDGIMKSFNDLLNAVALEAVPAAEGMEAISDAFPQIIEGLEEMGMKGSVEIGKLISRMEELGLETEEVQSFIKDKATSAISNLTKYFSYLSKQEEMTAEQAKAALTVMAGAFAAAVKATGSLVEAIGMLGEEFGVLLEKIREVVGEENAMLNGMQRYYNFVKNNEEQLTAIDALASGFTELIELGIINRENIGEYAASFKVMMEDMMASAEDPNMALMAMGPTIGQLLESYKEMGVAVPQWLADIAEEAEKANANMEPPEGLPDILSDIRDIMYDIADALGAGAENAKKLGQNLNDVEAPGGDYGGKYGGDFEGMAHGGVIRGYDYPGLGYAPLQAKRGLVVPPRRGGTNIIAGEGGKTELIAPVKDLADRIAGTVAAMGGGETIEIRNEIHITEAESAEETANAVIRRLETDQNQSLSKVLRKARLQGKI